MSEHTERRRVVVTGIGPVTPVGIGVDAFWEGLTTGRNGVRRIERFDPSDLPVQLAGEVAGFEPTDWMEAKEVKRTDRVAHFAVSAAHLAYEDAGKPEIAGERTGVVISTGIGGIETLLNAHKVLLERGPGRVSAFMVPGLMANASAGHVAMHFGLTGPNMCIVTACAAGAHGIGEAYRMIRDGMIDVALAGGTEAAVVPLTIAAFAQMQALTQEPRPGDGLAAVRPRARRVRPGGGRGRAGARVRGARPGPRRAHLRRDRGLRRLGGRVPHHRARAERHRRGASRCGMALADAGALAGGRRVHQRARHLDAAERRRRDRRHQGRARRRASRTASPCRRRSR